MVVLMLHLMGYLRTIFLFVIFFLSGSLLSADEKKVDFNRDIRPLISNSCIACHGPDEKKRKAKLRLDTAEGATREMDGRAAVVPGDLAKSEILYRLTTDNEDDLMPPEGKGRRFNSEEIALVKRWIKEGAHYARHWSYEKPGKVEPPKVTREGWVKNPVDHFILSRLEKEGLEPSPEADRLTLARRLALDVTGLPPTWEEASAFVHDKGEQALERYVDRLLASPAFGERWGRVWLDLARYADSAGYADDPKRTIWAYRDYVIRSLNENKPFDQFTIEQIAGDLLKDPTRDQLVATAFHRNTMTNSEGGTDDEEFRNEAIVDRVNTTFAVWMGTTMACAQCHTHKYDPITQEEFFRVFALFNQSEDSDKKDERPVLDIWSEKQLSQKAEWSKEIARLKNVLNEPTDKLAKERGAWMARLKKEPVWLNWKPIRAVGNHVETTISDSGAITYRPYSIRDNYIIEIEVPDDRESEISALRLTVDAKQTDNFVLSQAGAKWIPETDSGNSRKGRFVRIELPGKKRIIHLAEVEVFSAGKNIAKGSKATQSSTGSSGPAKLAVDGNTSGDYKKKSVSHTGTEDNPWLEIDLGSVKNIEKIVLWNRTDGGASIAARLEGYSVSLLDEKRQVVWEASPKGVPMPSEAFALSGVREFRFDLATATFEQGGFAAANVISGKVDPKSGWAISGGTGKTQELTLVTKTPVKVKGGKLVVTLDHQSEHPNHCLKHFRLAVTTDKAIREWAGVPADVRAVIAKQESERSKSELQKLADYFHSVAPSLKKPRRELAALEKKLAAYKPESTVPVMAELPADKHRKTHIQIRGNFKSLDKEVTPGVPAAFHPIRKDLPPNRLALAYWLIDKDNPLTPRVIVNRHWEQIFGKGIVETSEEFGSQGELPSHPELLDWLAVDLVENGWDLKRLIKQLVTSATYRQSSRITPEQEARDPFNRLLARGPRFRISAEMVRDQALAMSGLLSKKMYGPPVNPPQPNLGLKAAFGAATDWVTSKGEDKFRRGIYTTWRRSSPYPSMATFGAPNREVCTVRRTRTNTPLQALVTLNDPVYIEAAQALGRSMQASGKTDGERVRVTLRKLLIREPRESEVTLLTNLYQASKAHYAEEPDEAKKMAGPGKSSDPVAAAAWTVVGNVMLNLDEVFLKR